METKTGFKSTRFALTVFLLIIAAIDVIKTGSVSQEWLVLCTMALSFYFKARMDLQAENDRRRHRR